MEWIAPQNSFQAAIDKYEIAHPNKIPELVPKKQKTLPKKATPAPEIIAKELAKMLLSAQIKEAEKMGKTAPFGRVTQS